MTDFHSLYQLYAPQVHRFARYLCGDAALADDITSETFVRAWTARGKIREATVKASLLPFTFIFSGNRITWIMLRDNPKGAIMFGAFGIICWIIFFVHGRLIKKTGI